MIQLPCARYTTSSDNDYLRSQYYTVLVSAYRVRLDRQ